MASSITPAPAALGNPGPCLGSDLGLVRLQTQGFAAATVGRVTQGKASLVLEQFPKAPLVLPFCDQHGGCTERIMLRRQEEKWFSITL